MIFFQEKISKKYFEIDKIQSSLIKLKSMTSIK